MRAPLIYCFCSQCAQTALFELGMSALTPQQFIRRARRYHLTEEQQKKVDEIKLKLWNGEQAS